MQQMAAACTCHALNAVHEQHSLPGWALVAALHVMTTKDACGPDMSDHANAAHACHAERQR